MPIPLILLAAGAVGAIGAATVAKIVGDSDGGTTTETGDIQKNLLNVNIAGGGVVIGVAVAAATLILTKKLRRG